MKARKNVSRTALIVLAMLLLAAVPVAADQGVVQFRAHMTGLIPGDAPTPTVLPGGRLLLEGETLTLCYQMDEVEPGYVFMTGCFYCESSLLVEPSGTQNVWGTCETTSLTNRPGGGWAGTFAGTWSPTAKVVSLHSKYEGTGDLEGWSMTWREFALRFFTGPNPYEIDKGHFTPPQ